MSVVYSKTEKPDSGALPATVYGNSFTNRSLANITTGNSYYDLAAPRLGLGTITSYGVNGSRAHHVLNHMIASAAVPSGTTPVAGAVWPGVSARPGIVIMDTEVGDIAHGDGSNAVVLLAGAGGVRYLNAMGNIYQAMLAVASSEYRIEETFSAGSVDYSGTWNVAGAGYCSGGSYGFTSVVGAYVTYTIPASKIAQTGPLAGRGWLSNLQFDPGAGVTAPMTMSIDGAAATTITPDLWETVQTTNFRHGVVPFTLPVDGAAHTVRFTHAGAAGNLMTNDAVYMASPTPPEIFVMGASQPSIGTAYNSAAIPAWKVNQGLVSPRLKAAISLFPNAHYVPSTMTSNGNSSIDGLHPNDRGMKQRANDLVFAVRTVLAPYFQSRKAQLEPDSNFGKI